MAYSSEMAAALAYQGHASAVRRPDERDAILRIELEEWVHRGAVGRMLANLGERPARWREILMHGIGHALRAACPLSGWHLPMLVAWKLEEMNVGEYATAARLARDAGLEAMARELDAMSEVEWEHAVFFGGVLGFAASRGAAAPAAE